MNLDPLRKKLHDVEALMTPDAIALVAPETLIYWLRSEKSAAEIVDILEGPAGSPVRTGAGNEAR